MKKILGLMIATLGTAGCIAEDASEPRETGESELQSALDEKADQGEGPITPQGGCSSFPPTPCGEVQNNSVRTITISLNWTCSASTAPVNSSCAQSVEGLSSGRHRGGGNVDVDAFRVDTGCTYYGNIDGISFSRGSGWYKFSSLNTVTITSTSCGIGS